MKKNLIINWLFIVIIIGMVIVNIYSFFKCDLKELLYLLPVLVTLFFTFCLYKKKLVNKKLLYILLFLLVIILIIFRIVLINNINFELTSDFKLYFDTANEFYLNNSLSNINYLSYNSYVIFFSKLLSLFFHVVGNNITAVLYLNIFFQICTIIFIYLICKKSNNKLLAVFLALLWFALPSTILTGLLLSTENMFMCLFCISIFLMSYYMKIEKLNLKNIIFILLFALLLAFANNIRPIMILFLFCLVIVIFKKKTTIISLLLCFSFFAFNYGITKYSEHLIGTNLKSGSSSWAIYFGANYDSNGMWSESDSNKVFEVLNNEKNGSKKIISMSMERYNNLGLLKSTNLFAKKFYLLWTTNNTSLDFVNLVTSDTSNIKLYKYESIINIFSKIIVLWILIIVLIKYNIIQKNIFNIVIVLFIILYVIFNLFICVNSRYNYPVYFLLILLLSDILNEKEYMMKEKISKLVNVYRKNGFIGFCKKLKAYIIANYLDKISLKVIFNKKKYSKELSDILNSCKYDRIVLWRSSFGYNVELFQRPQHIANNLAKLNTLVFYEVTTMTDKVKILKKQSQNLYLVNYNNIALNKLLMKALSKISKPKYIQLYSTDWKLSVENIEKYLNSGFNFIYEYIDHISPKLSGTKELPKNISDKYEYVMKNDKVYVVVTADLLEKDVISKRGKKNLIFSSNGVDYYFFKKIDNNYKLEKEFLVLCEKPTVCYYGALASWFDYELIKKIDETNKYNIVLFGIKYDESLDNSKICELNNVYFMGPRDYRILKNYACKMDVMIIPFLLNEITASTSPVKLFEYMALKKPIVTTALNECKKYESVFIGKNHDDFIKKIDEAYKKREDLTYLKLLDKEARENDWKAKTNVIIDEIQKNEIKK